jgi:hypothetical protein
MVGTASPARNGKPTASTSDSLRAAMLARLGSELGKACYAQRSRTIEPVFGQVKTVQGGGRFMRRGCGPARRNGSCCAAPTTCSSSGAPPRPPPADQHRAQGTASATRTPPDRSSSSPPPPVPRPRAAATRGAFGQQAPLCQGAVGKCVRRAERVAGLGEDLTGDVALEQPEDLFAAGASGGTAGAWGARRHSRGSADV